MTVLAFQLYMFKTFMVVLVNAPSSGDILYQCIVLKKRRHKNKKRKLTVVVNINSIFCQKKAVNVFNYLHCIHKN